MVRETSIAPKERINVTFKPATGNGVEEIELPMKVTVLGDFIHRHDPRNIQERKPTLINKNNFDEVMAKQQLVLDMAVPNRLRPDHDDSSLHIELKIASMSDFEPGNIIDQVPEMQKMKKLRDALVSLKGPLGNLPTFRKAIEEVLKDPRQRDQILKEVAAGSAGPVDGKKPEYTPEQPKDDAPE
jgi:type VI secretion system protein ImpB